MPDRLTPAAIGLTMEPPQAPRIPTPYTVHGVTIHDDYAWLRDPSYPVVDKEEVLAYLHAENAYFRGAMKPYERLTEELFNELKGRLKDDDASVPFRDGDWLYHWSFDAGAQYRRWFRTPVHGGEPEVFIDEPALASGLEFFRLGGWDISPDGNLLAWSADDDGSERFTLHFKDLRTGRVFSDEIPQTIGSPVWAEDNQTVLYLELNDQWRPYRVRAHRLGTPPGDDPVLYEESDSSFFVSLDKTRSKELILISTGDHVTSEVRFVSAKTPLAPATLIAPRQHGLEYDVSHVGDRLFIRTNDQHKNFRVVTAPLAAPGRDNWKELIPGSDSVYITGLEEFRDFIVVSERVDGLDQILVRYHDGNEHRVAFPEAAYTVHMGANFVFAPGAIRLAYTSMVTPETVYDYHLNERRLEVLKVQEIPSGYDPSQYATERLMITARDGARVPVSVVYRRDFQKNGQGPLHLYAYGAYGHGLSPAFSTNRLSLLNRGFAYAVAHIRGGDEMGYHWYEDGKLKKRDNTFNDFIDAAKGLIALGFASPNQISISGGSAGGELMGVVLNRAPELWRACVADVPFVDVLNTMLDKDLPLTPIEWPEWGNPIEDVEAFHHIRSYSPYDNVVAQAYPPLLITAGLNDPRVTYWEPAKWAAKLRATKTDDNLLLLKTNMGAGHAGKTGRYARLEEIAEEYTFLLMAFGLAK